MVSQTMRYWCLMVASLASNQKEKVRISYTAQLDSQQKKSKSSRKVSWNDPRRLSSSNRIYLTTRFLYFLTPSIVKE